MKFWFWISSICRAGCFNFGIGIVNGIFNNFIRILPQVWFGNVNGRLIGRIDIYGSIKKKPEVGYIIVFCMKNSWNQSTILNEKKIVKLEVNYDCVFFMNKNFVKSKYYFRWNKFHETYDWAPTLFNGLSRIIHFHSPWSLGSARSILTPQVVGVVSILILKCF